MTVYCSYFLGIQNTPKVLLVNNQEDFATSNNHHAITDTTVIQNNVWYHAGPTYDGVMFMLYLKGKRRRRAQGRRDSKASSTSRWEAR